MVYTLNILLDDDSYTVVLQLPLLLCAIYQVTRLEHEGMSTGRR